MITKTKAKKPLTEKQANRSPKPRVQTPAAARRAEIARRMPAHGDAEPLTLLADPLTELDREAAFEFLWEREPDLGKTIVCMLSPADAIAFLRRRLLNCVGAWIAGREGALSLFACDSGITVRAAGVRVGVLTWEEIDAEARERWTWQDFMDPKKKPKANGRGDATRLPAGTPPSPPAASPAAGGIAPVDPSNEPARVRPLADVEDGPIVEMRIVKFAEIDTSKNPRRTFDQVKMAELAESIKQHGILQAIVVNRTSRDKFELVAGERRLRAAALVGVTRAVCRVLHVSDAEASELRVIENLQREDLTAIEEARAFADLITASKYTHKALAEKLGVSEAHVTNRLRLLKLPEKWQQKILSREMPATHARAVTTFADQPAILKAIEQRALAHDVPTDYRSFERQVEHAAEHATRPLSGEAHVEGAWKLGMSSWQRVPKFTAEQLAELKPITVGKQQRATNTKLFDKLMLDVVQAKAKKESREKTATKKAGREPTPAERKASQKKQAVGLRKWIADWRSDCLRRELSELVALDKQLLFRGLVMGLSYGDEIDNNDQRVLELIAPRTAGLKHQRAIAGCDAEGCVHALGNLVSEWLWNDEQAERDAGTWHGRVFDADAVEALAESARIDLAALWCRQDANLATEAFFARHTTAGLVALCKELKVNTDAVKKGDLVEALLNSAATWKRLPKSIAPVKPAPAGKKSKPARAKP